MRLYSHVGSLCSAFRRFVGIRQAEIVAVLENSLIEDCDLYVARQRKIGSYLSSRQTSLLHERTTSSLNVSPLFSHFAMLRQLTGDAQRCLLNQIGWPAFGLLKDPA